MSSFGRKLGKAKALGDKIITTMKMKAPQLRNKAIIDKGYRIIENNYSNITTYITSLYVPMFGYIMWHDYGFQYQRLVKLDGYINSTIDAIRRTAIPKAKFLVSIDSLRKDFPLLANWTPPRVKQKDVKSSPDLDSCVDILAFNAGVRHMEDLELIFLHVLNGIWGFTSGKLQQVYDRIRDFDYLPVSKWNAYLDEMEQGIKPFKGDYIRFDKVRQQMAGLPIENDKLVLVR